MQYICATRQGTVMAGDVATSETDSHVRLILTAAVRSYVSNSSYA